MYLKTAARVSARVAKLASWTSSFVREAKLFSSGTLSQQSAQRLAIFAAPLTVGLWQEIGWLTHLGLMLLFIFILRLYGYEWQRLQRRREVREDMRRILAERGKGMEWNSRPAPTAACRLSSDRFQSTCLLVKPMVGNRPPQPGHQLQ